jgi:pimeloyl-ACP methyl ester carboxylesterase
MKRLPLTAAALLLSAAPLSAADYPFQVKVIGKGKPMILIPGLCCAGEVWDSTVGHFKDRYECHVLTLAGFAGVPPAKGDKPFLDTMAEGIAAYARDKKLDKPVLVGHSLGATLALRTAASAPDQFGGVVMVDGFPATLALFMPDAPAEQRARFATDRRDQLARATREVFLKEMRGLFGQMLAGEKLEMAMRWVAAGDQPTAVKALAEVYAADARADVAKVRGPLLVLGAFNDGMAKFGLPSAEEMEKRLKQQVEKAKDGRVAVHPNCKHFIMYDEPKWLFEQMEKVLGGSK